MKNMSTLSIGNGRFGNQFIRHLAVSLLAEKQDLKVASYQSEDLMNHLGINLFSGSKKYEETKDLTDDNYFEMYNSTDINYNLSARNYFLQTKEITNFLYDYLNSDLIRSKIIEKNPFNDRYKKNNDLFIHIRLTDAEKYSPGINYYLNTIKNINFDNLNISTDDKDHDIVKSLFTYYPNAKLVDYDEMITIQFASTHKNVILSNGSFSAVIGYLSFFSNIYYPEYGEIWHGDMFSIKNWEKVILK
jgi:hypothetical protein